MVGNTISKRLALLLIFVALMLVIECSEVNVTGILGNNITLQFTFNISVTNQSHFAVYVAGGPNSRLKIAEYTNSTSFTDGDFYVYPENYSAFCHIRNLKSNDSRHYWASLFMPKGVTTSGKVQLIVRKENISSSAPPLLDDSLIPGGGGGSFHIIPAVVLVSPVVVLAAALCSLIWCLSRSKDKHEAPPHQMSNPTIQETVETSSHLPAPPLVYSVLDFPKRTSAVLEMNSSDTDYAAVRYLP